MLYTRKGDKGTTKLFNTQPGVRISKTSCQVEALGAVDELNCWLGLCRAKAEDEELKKQLQEVQQQLFVLQAELAGADKRIDQSAIDEIEKMIAELEAELPPISSFFLAGQTEISAHLDVARTICRRAERQIIQGLEAGEVKIGEAAQAFINRLSSWVYVWVRVSNSRAEAEEIKPNY